MVVQKKATQRDRLFRKNALLILAIRKQIREVLLVLSERVARNRGFLVLTIDERRLVFQEALRRAYGDLGGDTPRA